MKEDQDKDNRIKIMVEHLVNKILKDNTRKKEIEEEKKKKNSSS